MNKVHSALISHIRSSLAAEDHPTLTTMLHGKTDEQIVRMMFSNFRGRDSQSRGLRLTNFGMQVMITYFQAYEIEREGKPSAMELVYLNNKARLPYHVDPEGKMVMFDPELGIKLKLADGDITTLMEMDVALSDGPVRPVGSRKLSEKNS